MNTLQAEENWDQRRGKLKQKFAALLDNDLLFSEGKKIEMFERLQDKLGKTKEELNNIISIH